MHYCTYIGYRHNGQNRQRNLSQTPRKKESNQYAVGTNVLYLLFEYVSSLYKNMMYCTWAVEECITSSTWECNNVITSNFNRQIILWTPFWNGYNIGAANPAPRSSSSETLVDRDQKGLIHFLLQYIFLLMMRCGFDSQPVELIPLSL